jgi:hypothetical protein
MDAKLKELQALLRQKEGNLTEYGRERIRTLKKELRDTRKSLNCFVFSTRFLPVYK